MWLCKHAQLVILSIVLAALHQEKVIAKHDLQKWKGSAPNMLLDFILDQCSRPSKNVTTTADVLHKNGCKKEAGMLKCALCVCVNECAYARNTAIHSLPVLTSADLVYMSTTIKCVQDQWSSNCLFSLSSHLSDSLHYVA